MSEFAHAITRWYSQNKRDLPWRRTREPYKIWLSEIILQQTRVEQGRVYYEKFVSAFETVHQMAAASEKEILNLWQGLGYYSRARNLHKAAIQVVNEYGGTFPQTFDELKKLKGVGPYTAAAVASFAFGERVPVVDGNVYRFLGRYLEIDEPINTPKAYKLFFNAAKELMGNVNPANFNQALMESGALICKPKNAQCMLCAVQNSCGAFQSGRIYEYPVKPSKTKVQKRYLYYFILEKNDSLKLQLRDQKGIWQNLYEFPVVESMYPLEIDELHKRAASAGFIQSPGSVLTEIGEERVHKLSHRQLHARFYAPCGEKQFEDEGFVACADLKNYPLPRLIDRFIEEEKPHYYNPEKD